MFTRRTFGKLFSGFAVASPAIVRALPLRKVIVVGAGAAGLTAAYHLKKQGVDVRVLEASNLWGGRVKRLFGFSNVPLDLGAEWIHDDPTVLGHILSKGDNDLGVETIPYDPQTFRFWHDGALNKADMLRHAYEELKFRDTTWFGFFERFVFPDILGDIQLGAEVTAIGRASDGVSVRTRDGSVLEADRVLITVPISMLRNGAIAFHDRLDASRLDDLANIPFGGGFKVFLKFKERFYPDILLEGSRWQVLNGETWDSKIYYDAALRKPTEDNLLGLFTVAAGDLAPARLSDEAMVQSILEELSGIFGGVVRQSLERAVVQNWSQEPFIQGSYSMSDESDQTHRDILAPIDGRVFFAGEILGGDARATVHGAAFWAIDAVEAMKAA
mgnify:FL=1